MTAKTRTRCLALAIAVVASVQISLANQVTWTIDQSASKLTLAVPDQVININGTTLTLRIRNQSGSTASWNQGNVASLAGSLLSEYKELSGGPSLQFTSGGSVTGVNSGNYRPNPAAFVPTPSATNGTYANNTTAAGVYGARMLQPFGSDNINLGYLSYRNVDIGLAGTAALTGSNGNYTYSTSQASLGLDADLAMQGLNAQFIGQLFPNTILDFSTTSSALALGTATITNTGGLNRKMTIPVSVVNQFDLLGNTILLTLTGQIVSTAVVPEPSSFLLAGLGFVSLICARRRIRRR